METLSKGDFQKLLAIALQSLSIQQTLLENRMAELNEELRSLERDEEMERLDRRIFELKRDYEHYSSFIDPDFDLKADEFGV